MEECGISSISGEQQDAHEALVKLLEAVYVGLSHLAQRALVSFVVFCSAGKLKTINKSTNSRLCRYGSNYVKRSAPEF